MSKPFIYRIVPTYRHDSRPDIIYTAFDKLCQDLAPYDFETAIADDDLKTGYTFFDMQTNKPAERIQPFYTSFSKAIDAAAILRNQIPANQLNQIKFLTQTLTPTDWQNLINDTRKRIADSPILDPTRTKIHPKISDGNLKLCLQLKDVYGEVYLETHTTTAQTPHPLHFKKEIYDNILYFEKAIDDTLPETIILTTEEYFRNTFKQGWKTPPQFPAVINIGFHNSNSDTPDETQFDAESLDDLYDLWYNFCEENNLKKNTLLYFEVDVDS